MNSFHCLVLSPDIVFYVRAALIGFVTAAIAVKTDRWLRGPGIWKTLKREFIQQLRAEERLNRITGAVTNAPVCLGDSYCIDPMAPRAWMHHTGCPLHAYLIALEKEKAERPVAYRLKAVKRKKTKQ